MYIALSEYVGRYQYGGLMYVCMYRGNLNVRTLFGILSSHINVCRE